MPKKNQSHLNEDDRTRIDTLLREECSIRYIADRLDRSPSTISREINRHAKTITPRCCDCLNSSDCSLRHVCGALDCHKKCQACAKAKKYCPDYSKAYCDTLLQSPTHLCNACHKQPFCHFEKRIYDPKTAQADYRNLLVNSRNGFDLSASQFQQIDTLVSPLVRKGQSVYHIVHNNKDSLPVSESTIRRLIDRSELDVLNIDLPMVVKRKPRRHPQKSAAPRPSKQGHLYQDFLDFIQFNDTPVVQMDCVVGKQEDSSVILSLHFVSFHMQLFFSLESHTSAAVVRMLDTIEESLGKELFACCFPLILTDNGHEFEDIEGMQRSVFGGQRTLIFFCDPNRSDQKAQCETNHRLLREIIPKGTSIDAFMQWHMTLVNNHINSYARKSLFGKCPYELARATLPEDFFLLLGLEQIPGNEVTLKPCLLK